MKTIIQTTLNGDKWVASTPHAPELKAEHESESQAVNDLMAQIRAHGGNWVDSPQVAGSKDAITRAISGLRPQNDLTTDTTETAKAPRRRAAEKKTEPASKPEVKEQSNG